MVYLIEQYGVWAAWGGTSLFLLFRYLLFAGLAYFVFYKLGIKGIRKIQAKQPHRRQLWSEIGSSFQTILLFTSIGILVASFSEHGLMKIYKDIHAYPLWWMPVSFMLLLIIHDSYFYWIHRLMHKYPLLMKWHAHHHKSHNPTPFTSFSFHPGEAFLEVAIIPIVLFVLPCHQLVILVFTSIVLLLNVIGHLGFEPYPAWFVKHPILKWLNTSSHHNMHHKNGSYNFGFYFNFWDSWMGTNAPDYQEFFRKNAERGVLHS